MRIEWIDETGSTNTAVTGYDNGNKESVVLAARKQTAGRGQKGNGWESESGKNLSFSAMWFHDDFSARQQFSISEAVALCVVELLAGIGIESMVKWPNDVYVCNRKICGILIEHTVLGMNLERTVAGVGININQNVFRSDAPNPVSASMITGKNYRIDELLEEYVSLLDKSLETLHTESGRERMHERFMANLWRGDGKAYPFRESGTGEIFQGVIKDVSPMGFLSVENVENGEIRVYAFKEVEFLL